MVAALLVLPASAAEANHPGPCALHRVSRESTEIFVMRLIRCAVTRWPVPGGADKAICVARRESGLRPRATSEPRGLYVGLFQHDRRLWAGRFVRWAKPVWELSDDPLNGRSNTIVTVRMVHAHGWGPWKGPGC